MFNKFTDGISGLKTYVNSPALGRNQTSLHLAVKSNTAFAVNQLLNAGADPLAKDESGNTPLHIAAFSGYGVAVQAILEHESVARVKKELIETVNNEGDTPLHLSCKAPHVMCLRLLLDHGSETTLKNSEGLLAIQCLVSSPHADVLCLYDLLEHDPELISVTDKDGNTLLHCANNPKVIACLVDKKIDVGAMNTAGQPALHKIAMEETGEAGILDRVMALIHNGVPVDVEDGDGNTALHLLAAKTARKGTTREFLIKALVVLGADLKRRNKDGKTPFEVAKDATQRSTMTLLNCVGGNDDKFLNCKSYPALSPEVKEAALSSEKPRIRNNWGTNNASLLALDGGGIRGLVLIQILLDLERRSGLSCLELFDWVGGTSTGSMLSLGMTFCKMSLRDCQTLYFNLKDVVFKGSRPYNTEILENFMKEQFGENRMMNERSFPRVIVPATIADCRPCKLHVFRNYGYRSENGEPAPHQQRVWEAARSSSAAPTYFTPHKRFVDGGLMANNPTITMLTEMHDCNQDLGKLGYKEAATPVSFTDGLMRAVIGEDFSTREQDNSTKGYIESRPVDENVALVKDVSQEPTKPYIVVSLGTGLAPEVAVKDFNVSAVSGPLGAGRLLLSAKEFAETLVEQCAATDGAVVLGAKAWCESIGSYYFRLQPQMSYNMKMDEVENKNLIECLWDVQCFVYQNKEHLERITDLLMSAFQ